MKLDKTENPVKIIGNEGAETHKVSISASGAGHIISTLINLYADPIGSIVREITSNGVDATREKELKLTGKLALEATDDISYYSTDNNVYVAYKPAEEQFGNQGVIMFTDNGVGISKERLVEKFLNMGESTKRDSNDQIGAFGIGSKSPWAYTDSFYIKTRYNGIETLYLMNFIDGTNPEVTSLFVEDYNKDLKNGTDVIVPLLKKEDAELFEKRINDQLFFFTNVVFSGFENDIKNSSLVTSLIEEDFILFENNNNFDKVVILVGRVMYPMNMTYNGSEFEDLLDQYGIDTYYSGYTLALRCKIEEMQLVPSRESLMYKGKTLDTIYKKLAAVNKYKESFRELLFTDNSQDYLDFVRDISVEKLLDTTYEEFAKEFTDSRDSKIVTPNLDVPLEVLRTIFNIKNRKFPGMFPLMNTELYSRLGRHIILENNNSSSNLSVHTMSKALCKFLNTDEASFMPMLNMAETDFSGNSMNILMNIHEYESVSSAVMEKFVVSKKLKLPEYNPYGSSSKEISRSRKLLNYLLLILAAKEQGEKDLDRYLEGFASELHQNLIAVELRNNNYSPNLTITSNNLGLFAKAGLEEAVSKSVIKDTFYQNVKERLPASIEHHIEAIESHIKKSTYSLKELVITPSLLDNKKCKKLTVYLKNALYGILSSVDYSYYINSYSTFESLEGDDEIKPFLISMNKAGIEEVSEINLYTLQTIYTMCREVYADKLENKVSVHNVECLEGEEPEDTLKRYTKTYSRISGNSTDKLTELLMKEKRKKLTDYADEVISIHKLSSLTSISKAMSDLNTTPIACTYSTPKTISESLATKNTYYFTAKEAWKVFTLVHLNEIRNGVTPRSTYYHSNNLTNFLKISEEAYSKMQETAIYSSTDENKVEFKTLDTYFMENPNYSKLLQDVFIFERLRHLSKEDITEFKELCDADPNFDNSGLLRTMTAINTMQTMKSLGYDFDEDLKVLLKTTNTPEPSILPEVEEQIEHLNACIDMYTSLDRDMKVMAKKFLSIEQSNYVVSEKIDIICLESILTGEIKFPENLQNFLKTYSNPVYTKSPLNVNTIAV